MTNPLEILVVEDMPMFVENAKQVLTQEGVKVDIAMDYNEAIKKINSKKYDGCLIDLYFPEKKGSGNKELGKTILDECEKEGIKRGIESLREEICSKDESEQPLGLLIGKTLKEKGIPFVIVSSVYFGHGIKQDPFYALREYATIIGIVDEFGGYGGPVYEGMIEDVYKKIKESGMNIQTLKESNYNHIKGDLDWVQDKERWINMDDKEAVGNAIRFGKLNPIKGNETYKRALKQLKEKIK